MAVAFGTAVEVDMATSTSLALPSITVTSGQPIFVYVYKWNTSGPISLTDTFSTGYTWTLVDDTIAAGVGSWLYIGTGGVGTSGVITVNYANDHAGAVAVPCSGASTASGLSAIDVHGNNNGSGLTATSPTLTPGASGEGAFMCWGGGTYNPTDPTGSWTTKDIATSGTRTAGAAWQGSPTSGVGLSTTWVSTSSGAWNAVGAIVKAAAVPPTSGMLAVL